MSSTMERLRKRQQYLKRKVAAYSKTGIALFLAVPCALLTCILFILAFLNWTGRGADHPANLLAFAIGTIAIGMVCCYFILIAERGVQEVTQLSHVPPVTADTLPSEEVLVRGSEEPTQEQSKVLLRGTDGSTDTGEQELLRSSQEQSPKC